MTKKIILEAYREEKFKKSTFKVIGEGFEFTGNIAFTREEDSILLNVRGIGDICVNLKYVKLIFPDNGSSKES